MIDFLDYIRGGSAYNQGQPVAGDLPSDGVESSDIRSIFSLLSDTTRDVLGTVNSFKTKGQKNKQTPAVTGPNAGFARFLPVVVLVVAGVALWWFIKRK